jgi:hypothetical protein
MLSLIIVVTLTLGTIPDSAYEENLYANQDPPVENIIIEDTVGNYTSQH